MCWRSTSNISVCNVWISPPWPSTVLACVCNVSISPPWPSTVSACGSASSYTYLPTSLPNPDTSSSIPTIWTGKMASVSALHGNLSYASQKIVRSLHNMTAYHDSSWGRAGPCTLRLLGTKYAITRHASSSPWCLETSFLPLLHHLWLDLSRMLSLLLGPAHAYTFPCLWPSPRPEKTPLIRPHILPFMSPIGSIGGHVRAQWFHSVPQQATGNWDPLFHFVLIAWLATCFYVIFLGLFNPEDGGKLFLWNVIWLLTD